MSMSYNALAKQQEFIAKVGREPSSKELALFILNDTLPSKSLEEEWNNYVEEVTEKGYSKSFGHFVLLNEKRADQPLIRQIANHLKMKED